MVLLHAIYTSFTGFLLLFSLLRAEAMTINKVLGWCAPNFSVHHCGFGWCFLVPGAQEIEEQPHNLSPNTRTHIALCTKSINIYDNLSMWWHLFFPLHSFYRKLVFRMHTYTHLSCVRTLMWSRKTINKLEERTWEKKAEPKSCHRFGPLHNIWHHTKSVIHFIMVHWTLNFAGDGWRDKKLPVSLQRFRSL